MMSVHTACESIEQDQYTLGTMPPNCRSVELQISPIMSVDLVRPSARGKMDHIKLGHCLTVVLVQTGATSTYLNMFNTMI